MHGAWHGNGPSFPHRGAPWGGGPPPWVNALFGSAVGGKAASMRPPRVRRGDVRVAILDVLSSQPMNGYQLIQQIAERSNGQWKPSPGSVYPTLQQLEDEGLVRSVQADGRKAVELTDAGRRYVETNTDEIAATWEAFGDQGDDDTADLRGTISQVAAAVWQVAVSGTPRQQEQAKAVLADTRRQLYGLLADGDDEQ